MEKKEVPSLIEVKHLTKRYGDHTAVSDLTFSVEEGQVYGFLGPNGAGKSTTMNIMTGCLAATSGEVTIHMPKLKGMRFTTSIIERYRRRETSVEETMIEMYLAGVSTRRIEDVSEILWGSSVSAVSTARS